MLIIVPTMKGLSKFCVAKVLEKLFANYTKILEKLLKSFNCLHNNFRIFKVQINDSKVWGKFLSNSFKFMQLI